MAKKIKVFLLGYLLFLLISFFLIFSQPKIELHLWLNSFHTPFLDSFFRYFTNIGDGAFALVFLPYFFFFTKARTLFYTLLGCLTAGILAQVFKKLVFTSALRPSAIIDEHLLHTVEGVKLATLHSFPSGHSASVFAFMLALALLNHRNKMMQVFFCLCAILGAYSRVYLSQHFLLDTLAGSFLGVLSVFFAYAISNSMKWLPSSSFYSYFRQKARRETPAP